MDSTKITKGETLLEALIATTVLMIVLSYGTTVFTSATQNMTFNRDRSTAMFLAQEGIEGVKNIIGSNLIRLSSDKDNCWNAGWEQLVGGKWSPIQDTSKCIGLVNLVKKISGSEDLNLSKYARLLFDLQNDNNKSLFRLDFSSTDYQLKKEEIFYDPQDLSKKFQRYSHESGTLTNFSRKITIQYFDNINDPQTTPNAMKVTSTVTWMTGNKQNKVEYATILTKDYAL